MKPSHLLVTPMPVTDMPEDIVCAKRAELEARRLEPGETIYIRGMVFDGPDAHKYDRALGPFKVLTLFALPERLSYEKDRFEDYVEQLIRTGVIEPVRTRTIRVKEFDGECWR